MAVITEMPKFKITNIIFSKKQPFTIDELINEIRNMDIPTSEEDVKRTLKRLKESGMIIQHGSRYSLYKTIFN